MCKNPTLCIGREAGKQEAERGVEPSTVFSGKGCCLRCQSQFTWCVICIVAHEAHWALLVHPWLLRLLSSNEDTKPKSYVFYIIVIHAWFNVILKKSVWFFLMLPRSKESAWVNIWIRTSACRVKSSSSNQAKIKTEIENLCARKLNKNGVDETHNDKRFLFRIITKVSKMIFL